MIKWKRYSSKHQAVRYDSKMLYREKTRIPHLTCEKRVQIEILLHMGMSKTAIARRIGIA